MNIRLEIVPLLLLLLSSSNAIIAQPLNETSLPRLTEVKTLHGGLVGSSAGASVLFKGIPYARPPIGSLRWQPPQALKPWSVPIMADNYGPACPQPRSSGPAGTSEDCLTLNIASPASALKKGSEKLAVLFSLHGGGFVGGSGDPVFNVAPVLNENNIVLVTLNYRLGALGFFAHPELDMKYGANFGLLDMVAALRWVQDNISEFGGDPKRITIQGISAGGQAVNMLMVHPHARGLFAGAIAQSGYGAWPIQPRLGKISKATRAASAEQQSLEIAARASTNDTAKITRDKLYQLKPAQLFGAIKGFHLPIIDGITLPEETAIMFARGQQHAVPYLSGGTSFDGSIFPLSGVSSETVLSLTGDDQQKTRSLWGNDFAVSERQGVMRLFGDIRYLYSGWSMSRAMAAIKQPGYLYLFDYVSPAQRDQQPGATHGSDGATLWADYSSDTAEKMRQYWMNFIKTGNPNDKGLPQWETTNAGEKTHWMMLGEKVEPALDIRDARLQFLDQLWRSRTATE